MPQFNMNALLWHIKSIVEQNAGHSLQPIHSKVAQLIKQSKWIIATGGNLCAVLNFHTVLSTAGPLTWEKVPLTIM